MQELFTPHLGLMVWTVVTFLIMTFILGRFGWGPLVKGLQDRENYFAEQKKKMEEARQEAEQLRSQYDKQLADAQRSIQDMVAQARTDAERTRAQLTTQAKEEADKILEKGRKDLAMEADRLKEELRKDVAEVSLNMAEKVLEHAVEGKVRESVLGGSIDKLKAAHR